MSYEKQFRDALYKKSLNPNSKWYSEDLKTFMQVLSTKSDSQLRQQLANMNGIMGLDAQTNLVIEHEEKRMAKYGMYDLGNMKPENALD